MQRGAATMVLNSDNRKIGCAAATYVSVQASCPRSCALRGSGCYAQYGHVAKHVRRLDAEGATALEAACDEAALIRAFPTQGRPLRLHVAGDCRTDRAARIVGAAAADWRRRRGGEVWTYTHAWRVVSRAAWGKAVSVLASMERADDAQLARERGYAPALVVAEHDGNRRRVEGGVTWIPCAEETRGLTCTECRLCLDADRLRDRGLGIAFAAHSQGRKRVLRVLQGEGR
jgi:hypothetical protein